MACNDRQLTQAQREAAYQQQRTGVARAVRPFSGSATIENLIDYINRELGPAVRASRDAINECFLQVADNAPSANPLAFYFSASVAAADPTVGRIRLNASPQDTATILRVSQSNARLVDVAPWLDVMAGGPTTPLGVVTLVDAINPSRFIRWDLNTMTDQGAYWDLGVTVIESSHDDPFVEDEAVVVSFIAGVSAAGSTVPVGSLSPVARDTFLGNIGTTTAAPGAVPLASVDSTSVAYDGTAHEFQRAALTGDVTATANSNTTTITDDAVTNAKLANMAQATIKLRASGAGTGDPIDGTVTQALDMAGSTRGSLLERGASSWGIITPGTAGMVLVSQGAGADPVYAKITSTGSLLGWDDVLSNDATSGATSPIVSAGQTLLFANGASPSGVSDSGTSLQMVASTNSAIDIRTIGSGKDVVLTAQGTGGDVRFEPNSSGGSTVCGSGIVVSTSSTYSLASNEGELSFGAPNDRPIVKFRTAVDTRQLAFQAMTSKTTASSVTNATTVLDATGTYTIPAGTLAVGTRFRCEFTVRFTRGGTATALNISASFDIDAAGISVAAAAQTAAGTYTLRFVAEFTVLTTGAGGTFMGNCMSIGSALVTAPQHAHADTITGAIDTTGDVGIRGVVAMSAGVANTMITITGGDIQWVT